MAHGNYWGSAEHRKIIAEEKKDVLKLIKELAEEYVSTPTELKKLVIDDQYAYYKRLLDYRF